MHGYMDSLSPQNIGNSHTLCSYFSRRNAYALHIYPLLDASKIL